MAVTFKIKVGAIVRNAGERYMVIEITDINHVLCRSLTTNNTTTFPVQEISPDDNPDLYGKNPPNAPDLASIPIEEWRQASKNLELVRGLHQMGRYRRTHADIELVAKATEKSTQTIYRWLSLYEKDSTITSFLPKQRIDKGRGRLSEEVDAVIQDTIKKLLLKREFGTIKDVHRDVKRFCLDKNLPVPGKTAIRDRFLKISDKERVSSRQGKKVAKEKFSPLRGSFPGADHPLDVIQIDHTPADVIIVDDIYRKPIGRPTLTIAIDVCTRALMGFNMWLEAPSAASTGLCIFHALLPKEKWMEARSLNAKWPCYGKPRKIHTDNAKEFRGTVLGRACKSYGIDLEQRPKGSPNFGGHVERGFRTYLRKIHTLQGTTFSNTRSKFDYDSSGRAILTLKEFEYWFTIYIAKIYHNDFHTGVKTTPIALFQEGILGVDGKPGIGLPERFIDEEKLRLDFLPFVERTVQEYGVLIDHIYYNDDILRSRIHENDPGNPRSARKFIFRRDPSDISVIYFWEPDSKGYKEIPYAHRGRPPASLWEVRAAIRERIARGKAAVDENMIFEGIDEMREIERKAAINTTGARRNEQRRRDAENRRKNKKIEKPVKEASPQKGDLPSSKEVPQVEADDDVITAFDDIDMRS